MNSANDAPGTVSVLDGARSRARLLADLGAQILVADGAMGTMLLSGGVALDRCLPELSRSRPDLVHAVHRAYITAGANLIGTNTFGASRVRLARHGLERSVAEINERAVALAQEVRADMGAHAVLIAGSVAPVTPIGSPMVPPSDELKAAFREQMEALISAGADLLVLESFYRLSELIDAVETARQIGAVPVIAQMTFVEDGRTLTGDTPGEVARRLDGLGVAAIGANCVLGPRRLLGVVKELGRYTTLPLVAQPNAGPPVLLDGTLRYTADTAYFARHAASFVKAGATIVGGCCGTTPTHTEALAVAVRSLRPVSRETGKIRTLASRSTPIEAAASVQSAESPFAQKLAARAFVAACEMSPPETGDAETAARDAARLHEAGFDAVVVSPMQSSRAQVSSASLALLIQQRVPGLEAVLTLTTWDRSVIALQADLLGAHAFGLRHVICRTGTPPLGGDYPNAGGVWDIDGVGLSVMVNGLNQGHDHHGMPLGRPTSFIIGARVHPTADDLELQLRIVRAKIDAGAHYLITPPLYDIDALQWMLEAVGSPDLPVLLGVMPFQDFAHAEYLQHEVPDTVVPHALLERMRAAGDHGPEVGVDIALGLIEQARSRGLIHGVAFTSAASGSLAADELLRMIGALRR
ncbi:MAG: bifunctional homocysteine S-methyltransferase/methylenetetrahydrofolate reductase [Chloroflexota bacterium]